MRPTISILTATWNRASLLEGAIQSVLSQTFPDWEHLVIDDGSTDETATLLKRLTHPRLRTLSTENRGQAEALNLGIREARGEWLAFLDSDDEFFPQHLESLVKHGDGYDLLLARFALVNCGSDPDPRVRDFYRPGLEIPVREIEVITGVLFVRLELAKKLGGFRKVASTDTDFFQRALTNNARWKRLESPTYRYFFARDSANSMALRDLASEKNRKDD